MNPYRHIAASIILVSMLWVPVYNLTILTDFLIRNQQIRKEQCVQRFNPDNHCQGACQFRMKQTQESTQEMPALVLTENSDVFQFNFKGFAIYFKSEVLPVAEEIPSLREGHLSESLRPPANFI